MRLVVLLLFVCAAVALAAWLPGDSTSPHPAARMTASDSASTRTDSIVLDTTAIDGFVARQFDGMPSQPPMPYRLFAPRRFDRNQRYPLVIWLHGSGGIGTDNKAQISGDQIPGTRTWTTPESQAAHPAFVLVPQSDNIWFSARTDSNPRLDQVLAIIALLEREYPIDPARVYVSGQSLGGAGTWGLISRRGNPFAAAIILCAAGVDAKALPIAAATMPIWIFQGAKDVSTTVSTARDLAERLRAAGRAPKYTLYADLGHDIWTRTFKEPGLAEWLFAQHR